MKRHSGIASLSTVLLAACAAGAPHTELEPSLAAGADPGVIGPLFTYGQPNGRPGSPGGRTVVVDVGRELRVVGRLEDDSAQFRPLARLGTDFALFASNDDELRVLELSSGAQQVLVPGGSPLWVHGDGSDALLWIRRPDEARGARATGRHAWRGPFTGELCRLTLQSGGASLSMHWARGIQAVYGVRGGGAWVATAQEAAELWFVPFDPTETPRQVCEIDRDWDVRNLQLAFSPDGERLALGATPADGEWSRYDLAVVDLRQGEIVELVRSFGGQGAGFLLSHFNGSIKPFWSARWRVGLPAGGTPPLPVLDLTPAGCDPFEGAGAIVDRSRLFGRARLGPFEARGVALEAIRERGEGELVLQRESEYLAFMATVSPDGRWIAIDHGSGGRELFDSRSGARTRLVSEWTHDGSWLPDAAPVGPVIAVERGESAALDPLLGQRVRLSGTAMHARSGPCLDVGGRELVFLPEWTAFEGSELGQPVTVEGDLQVWDGFWSIHHRPERRFYGEYALRRAERVE